ncbi:hypothetical protein ACQ4PT_064716 [Festuca glaucescens]
MDKISGVGEAAVAAPVVEHVEKAEAEAAVAAQVVEQLVKEEVNSSVEAAEVEDLKKVECEAGLAAPKVQGLEKAEADAVGEDLEKGESDVVVVEEGEAVVAAPVVEDLGKAEAEAFVAAAEVKDLDTAEEAEQSVATGGSNKRKFEEVPYPSDSSSDGSLEDDIALYGRISVRPLMRNWTEAAVALRDNYDQENGRGRGIVKIEDNITERYRRDNGKTATAKQKGGADMKNAANEKSNGKSNAASRSTKKPTPSWEMMMEINMKRMLQELKKEIIHELPHRCAKREQIAADVLEYNSVTTGFFPDVSHWPIRSYDMAHQKDGNSCGLFVLQFMEHWDGDNWTAEVSQEKVNASRKLINAQIVLATTNLLDKVKSKVVRISTKIDT